MVLPIHMSVHEMQCGSLVHLCMVNLGYEKSGHRSNLVLRLAHALTFNFSLIDVSFNSTCRMHLTH